MKMKIRIKESAYKIAINRNKNKIKRRIKWK